MKNIKRAAAASLLVLAMTVGLTACGGNDKNKTDDTTEVTTTVRTEEKTDRNDMTTADTADRDTTAVR